MVVVSATAKVPRALYIQSYLGRVETQKWDTDPVRVNFSPAIVRLPTQRLRLSPNRGGGRARFIYCRLTMRAAIHEILETIETYLDDSHNRRCLL